MIKFTARVDQFIDTSDLEQTTAAAGQLLQKVQAHPMAGWLDLPESYDQAEFARIKTAAQKIQAESKYLVCIGVGGSYLGHRAIIAALQPRSNLKILYAGNSLSPIALRQVLDQLGDADFSINIISKSGTTLEPAIAFRIFKQKLIEKYGETAAYQRIYATTDARKGALHDEAVQNGYETFTVPDNIGGRYSVLTAVGLLPIASAGINPSQLMKGAALEREVLLKSSGGPAASYAATRRLLDEKGYSVEVLASFEPTLLYFNEWWKQLAGESEGKARQGIFPAAVINTTDLHSLGQYIQDGKRQLFETVVNFTTPTIDHVIPTTAAAADGLSHLANQPLSRINQAALAATLAAHRAGGVPILEITAPDLSAQSLGALIYFFELAIALSGTLAGINPFDQPGVDAYKTNLARLLNPPDPAS